MERQEDDCTHADFQSAGAAGENVAPEEESGQTVHEQKECSICYSSIEQTEDGHAAPAGWLTCIHAPQFHEGCLHEALKRTARCPLCKAKTTISEFLHAVFRGRFQTIMDAVIAGDVDAVEYFFAQNQNSLNVACRNGGTPLVAAVQEGNREIVQFLLENGADIKAHTNDGGTALMVAAQRGHTEILSMLVKAHADINAQSVRGWTALMLAAEQGHTETVKALLGVNADDTMRNDGGWTALMIAANRNRVEVVAELLKHNMSIINAFEERGNTALIFAAQAGHTESVKVLLVYKADVTIRNNDGLTALLLATDTQRHEIVELLLENGVAVDECDKKGITPLIIAAVKNDEAMMRLLLKHKANVNVVPSIKSINSVLMTVLMKGNYAIAEYMVKEHDADLELAVDGGKTLLMSSLVGIQHYGALFLNMVKFLLAHGARIDARTEIGQTPLIYTSQLPYEGMRDVLDVLLQAGAQINDQDNNGLTTLMYAVNNNNDVRAIELLCTKGAQITHLFDKNNLSVIARVALQGRRDVVKILLNQAAKQSHAAIKETTKDSDPEDVLKILLD